MKFMFLILSLAAFSTQAHAESISSAQIYNFVELERLAYQFEAILHPANGCRFEVLQEAHGVTLRITTDLRKNAELKISELEDLSYSESTERDGSYSKSFRTDLGQVRFTHAEDANNSVTISNSDGYSVTCAAEL